MGDALENGHELVLGLESGFYVNDLANRRRVAATTQNQALSAILFLYREVMGCELPWLDDLVRAKIPARMPVVLTVKEVQAVLVRIGGVAGLVAQVLYGSGLRLMEGLRMRTQDLDLERGEIAVRQGKGRRDRLLPLGERLLRGGLRVTTAEMVEVVEMVLAGVINKRIVAAINAKSKNYGVRLGGVITGQLLRHVGADIDLPQLTNDRAAFEKQNPSDELLRVLHLVDRFVILVFTQRFQTPVLEHAGVQKVLVDRGEFVLQHLVQVRNDFVVAFHGQVVSLDYVWKLSF